MKRCALAAALATALASLDTAAVYVSPDGLGQALIFPAFSVQAAGGNSWNTYLTVVNHAADVKAVRVRMREGRNGREVWGANLYLAPNDVWTAALVPSSESDASPAMILTPDRSCTEPPIPNSGTIFSNALYSGTRADGMGEGLDRTREGYVEMLEMATLTGASATAVTQTAGGTPANCAAISAPASIALADVRSPTGGLSGSLTLINVNNGMDMAANAEALAELSVFSFFRPAADPYPDFDSAQVGFDSRVVAGGKEYRQTWPRQFDAVSAALMRSAALNEYVLDPGTHSSSTWIVTLPTRRFYAAGTESPFRGAGGCVAATLTAYDREGASASAAPRLCFASTHLVFGATSVFGGRNRFDLGALPGTAGWARLTPESNGTLGSGPDSATWDLAANTTATGNVEIRGLPMMGFAARTFENGQLACGAIVCQGNYGGSFPHRYRRSLNPF